MTLDFYNIQLKNRIVLGEKVFGTEAGDTQLDEILTENDIANISFFANALDTRTSGIDFVAHYNGLKLKKGQLSLNLSVNYTIQNKRIGAVKNPEIVEEANQSILNETQESLFFTSRPKFKGILGIDYSINKFSIYLNNTLFGPTIFNQAGMHKDLYTKFKTKLVTDIGLKFQATEKLSFLFNVNNLFDVLPEWEFKAENANGEALLNDAVFLKEQSNLITFNQRYSQMTYDGYHFSQLGTLLNLSATLQF